MIILQLTQPLHFMTPVMMIMEIYINRQDQRIQLSSLRVVNVWSKITTSHSHSNISFAHVDTNVPILEIPKYFIGAPPYLTTAASPAPTQFTKLIVLLILLSLKMSARVLRHKCAEKYQV